MINTATLLNLWHCTAYVEARLGFETKDKGSQQCRHTRVLLSLSGYRGCDLLLRAPSGRAHVRRAITLAQRLPVDAGLHFHCCTSSGKKLKTIEKCSRLPLHSSTPPAPRFYSGTCRPNSSELLSNGPAIVELGTQGFPELWFGTLDAGSSGRMSCDAVEKTGFAMF